MKKTNGNGNSNSNKNYTRPGNRTSAYTTTPVVRKSTGEPVRTKSAPLTKKNNKKKGKSFGAKLGIAALTTVLVAAAAGAAIYFTGLWRKIPFIADKFETKYSITLPDGTVAEYTEDELHELVVSDVFFEGTVIDGIDVSGMTKDNALSVLVQNQPERPISTNVSLEIDDVEYPVDLTSLTFESNLNEIVEEAYALHREPAGQEPQAYIDLYNARNDLKNSPVSYTSAYTLTTDGISGIIHGMLDDMTSEAVEAEITGFNVNTLEFIYTQSSKGYEIDIDGAVNNVKSTLDSGIYDAVIHVDAEVTEPEFTTEMIESEFGKISSTSTQTTANENRNHNINITCQKIDGYFLLPGETFSFNGYIGQRTAASGYRTAGTIQDGQLKDDFGGGICQVSSMIYQSVVKADLFDFGAGYKSEGQERNEHMWPSSYADAGTDAAVDWPNQDFKFTNISDYPVAIHSYWDASTSRVTVEIYGHLLPDGMYIGFEGYRASTSPARTDYIADPSMPVGTSSSIRGAHDGVTANSYQIWYNSDGTENHREELPVSRYATVNAQVSVGVRNPDGSVATLDPATGHVTGGTTDPNATTTVDPSASTDATGSTDTTTGSTDATSTTASTDATSTTAATESTTAAPTETTAAPVETTAAPVETTAAPAENPPA